MRLAMKPGAQGRRDAVRACRRWIGMMTTNQQGYADPADWNAYRAMRRKLVAAMRRAVNETVASERKAGR